jgi:chorismate mutase
MKDKSLDNWRKEIDTLDNELLTILAKRFEIVRKIGKLKKEQAIKPLDKVRWQKVLEEKITRAKTLHLSKKFVVNLYTLIHEYALELEGKEK